MSKVVKGIGALFSGGGSEQAAIDEQRRIADQSRETQNLQLDRQQQQLQQQQQQQEAQAAQLGRVPRGRRLLLAATGDQGLPGTLGG